MTASTGATGATRHVSQAESHLEAAKAFRLQLDDEYAAGRPDARVVADLHDRVRFGLKAAEVHALIANAVSAERFDLPAIAAERFGTGPSRLG